jgi:hypothetical protein
LITPIATFLTGILSGIMLGKTDNRDDKKDGPEQPELGPAKEPLELLDEADDHIA